MNFKVGDVVYNEMMGTGDVVRVSDLSDTFKVKLRHSNNQYIFHMDGVWVEGGSDCKPCLTLVERPVDWSTVKPGTEFEVAGAEGSEIVVQPYRFYAEGKPWFGKGENVAVAWPEYRKVGS